MILMLLQLLLLLFLLANTASSFIVTKTSAKNKAYDLHHQIRPCRDSRRSSKLLSVSSSTTTTITNKHNRWLDQGLLLSSFSDGLKSNHEAQNWLFGALTNVLWKEEQLLTQQQLKASVLASPCNGPDPAILDRLEHVDDILHQEDDKSNTSSPTISKDWQSKFQLLSETKHSRLSSSSMSVQEDCSQSVIDIRIVFIPTASYAIRSDSNNTPGKQRQRARADGKKRRTELVQLLKRQFEECHTINKNKISIRAVTLDLDDGSIKQPEVIMVTPQQDTYDCDNNQDELTSTASTVTPFPSSGEDSITTWSPHLIYVQGGNTFWLHHCMEKGHWTDKLVNAVVSSNDQDDGDNDSSDDDGRFPAVYCGVSAGAILMGQSMQTACWKEWDDPSVVPGRETYNDWLDVYGLNLVGNTSFFPHMEDRWKSLVNDRKNYLPINVRDDDDEKEPRQYGSSSYSDEVDVCCLTDEDALIVKGKDRSISILSSVPSLC